MDTNIYFCTSSDNLYDCDVRLIYSRLKELQKQNKFVLLKNVNQIRDVLIERRKLSMSFICHGNEDGNIFLHNQQKITPSFWSDFNDLKFLFIVGCYSYNHLSKISSVRQHKVNYGGFVQEIDIILDQEVDTRVNRLWVNIFTSLNEIVDSTSLNHNYTGHKILGLFSKAINTLEVWSREKPLSPIELALLNALTQIKKNIKFCINGDVFDSELYSV